MQCVNCARTSPPPLIRFGHAITIGLRVPPRWLAVCLPQGNGVLLACAQAAAKCGAVWKPPYSLNAAELLDQGKRLVGVEHDPVEERRLVERAGECPFDAGAVVAPDEDDQGIVAFAHRLDGVETAGLCSSRRL